GCLTRDSIQRQTDVDDWIRRINVMSTSLQLGCKCNGVLGEGYFVGQAEKHRVINSSEAHRGNQLRMFEIDVNGTIVPFVKRSVRLSSHGFELNAKPALWFPATRSACGPPELLRFRVCRCDNRRLWRSRVDRLVAVHRWTNDLRGKFV